VGAARAQRPTPAARPGRPRAITPEGFARVPTPGPGQAGRTCAKRDDAEGVAGQLGRERHALPRATWPEGAGEVREEGQAR